MRIDVRLPADMPAGRRAELAAAEHEHGLELRRRGTIARIWRLPGGQRNVGIWQAADATELHAALAGLPLYAWLEVEVSALAVHPLEGS